MRTIALCCMLSTVICIANTLSAQDVEQEINQFNKRWNENPVLLSGTLGLSTAYYTSDRNTSSESPFIYNIYGSMNLDILGVSAPLGIFYSNRNTRYNLPAYHFIGISPSYRGHTLHLGDRNMVLGPYSFSDLGYSGIGAESKLGSFHIRALYGRIRKASLRDLQVHNNLESSYRRMAWGAGMDYNKKDLLLGVHLFRAWDDQHSLPPNNPDSILPRSGTILGLKGAKKFGILTFRGEYAYNVLNRNKTLETLPGRHSLFGVINGMQPYNNATGVYHAFNTAIDINIRSSLIALEYERIDPGYESPGTLYFNNDLETMALQLRSSFFKNKLNAQLRGGVQRNNLKNDQLNSFRRWVSSATIGIKMDKKTNLNLSFSNFLYGQKSYISTTPFVDVDTLVLTQNNLNAGLNILRQIGSHGRASVQLAYNKAQAINNGTIVSTADLSNYLGSAGYVMTWEEQKMNLGTSLTYSRLDHFAGRTILWGPSVNISRDILKEKCNISFNTGWYRGQANEDRNSVLRFFLNNSWKLKKSLRAELQLMYTRSNSGVAGKSNDFMVNSGINYELESKPLIKSFSKKKKPLNEN